MISLRNLADLNLLPYRALCHAPHRGISTDDVSPRGNGSGDIKRLGLVLPVLFLPTETYSRPLSDQCTSGELEKCYRLHVSVVLKFCIRMSPDRRLAGIVRCPVSHFTNSVLHSFEVTCLKRGTAPGRSWISFPLQYVRLPLCCC